MKIRIALVASFLAVLTLLQTSFSQRPAVSSAAPAGDLFVYLPVIHKPILEDLTIDRLIISQAVQDDQNQVPLVAQRNTVVRVFARRIDGTIPNNITVSLKGMRGNTLLGTLVSAPRGVPDAPSRAVLGSTFNFLLPAHWLSGNVSLVATVDAAGVVVEANESNNVFQQNVVFNAVPPLTVRIVPVNYTHTGAKAGFYPGQQSDVTAWLRRTFPLNAVNVEFHSAWGFTGNLSLASEWSRLLNSVTDLKIDEIGLFHPTVYYALVPISNGTTRWFDGGVAGIGWVGARISTGLNLSGAFGAESAGVLAAHEIGHNFGRHHAPCGVETDKPYPYAGASIGQYGLDINGSSFSLLRPEDKYVDMMSYCRPEWISDFTYEKLYEDQITNGVVQSGTQQEILVIRGAFDQEGLPRLQPTYLLSRAVSSQKPSPEGYWVELLDGAGQVMASQPVAVLHAEEPGVTVRGIHAEVPMPGGPVAAVRLVQSGRPLAQRPLAAAADPLLAPAGAPSLAQAADGQIRIRWSEAETPALVRYTADGGQNWTALGIDVMGGELIVDRRQLPGPGGQFEITLADQSMPARFRLALSAP